MNPKQLIQALISALDADKTMLQPYKNYALSDAKRLQALIEYDPVRPATAPSSGTLMSQTMPSASGCICTPGQKAHASCPAHGIQF